MVLVLKERNDPPKSVSAAYTGDDLCDKLLSRTVYVATLTAKLNDGGVVQGRKADVGRGLKAVDDLRIRVIIIWIGMAVEGAHVENVGGDGGLMLLGLIVHI